MDILGPKELIALSQNNEEGLKSVKKEVESQKRTLNIQWALITAIFAVFLVTFVILIANSARFKGKQIEQYQETIEKIRQENIELKIQNQIKTYLKENQNKKPYISPNKK